MGTVARRVLVDLRSDTVTKPSEAMRRAMASAVVGDDGYGEDPTVRALEEAYAERVGKESAVFVPSGTMANQIALRVLGRPGTVVVAGAGAHLVRHEMGAAGTNATAQLHPIADDDGTLDPAEVARLVEAHAHHWPEVSAVAVENTHMPSGGRVWPVDRLEAVAAVGVPVHLDGARLFNAEVASGVAAARFAAPATTVMTCLSKGLGAPVGSVLAGPADLIEAARVERKRLGGAMRQAGVLAAAGLVALHDHVDRLAEDHARAARLASALGIDAGDCPTNCVVFRHDDAAGVLAGLRERDVLAGTIAPGTIRLMTHLDVDGEGIESALAALSELGLA
jgi:threonine aldolase